MNRTFAAGVALTAVSVLGYVVGVLAPYPGRAFALSGLMVGITVAAISTGEGA
ncbi:hypothetical protein [Halorubellus litoreus]|uniref:Uncharacterized protein n=1 Tax=Halorubellus litoreus TaxID=755308 RepID=A0ABD5VHQ5_9EURY